MRTPKDMSQHIYAGGDIARGPASVVELALTAAGGGSDLPRVWHRDPAAAGAWRDLTVEEMRRVKRARARQEVQHRPERLPDSQRGAWTLSSRR